MRSQLQAYLNFCARYQFSPFPVSKYVFLAYLVFLSHSLASYQSLLNYINILKHINNALGADLTFMFDYNCFLTQRGLRRVMGDHVYHTFPITIDILLRIFQSFQPRNVFHACMPAAFLVTFFSFLRISNLVPYTLSEVHSNAISSFVIRILLSQLLVLTFTFLRPRPFSSSKRSWRYPFPLSLAPFCVR